MFCMKCGAKNEDGAMFCGECGTALQQISNLQQTESYQKPQQVGSIQQAPMQPQGYYGNAGEMQQVVPMSAAAIISFVLSVLALVMMVMELNERPSLFDLSRSQIYREAGKDFVLSVVAVASVISGICADTKNRRGKAFEIMGIIFGMIGLVFFGFQAFIEFVGISRM